MRLAVFSDVHGNLTALEAVLADIASQQVDEVIFGGDLCLVGPRPAECVAQTRAVKTTSIYGNTDDWVLGRQLPPARLQALADWTLAQLDADARAWLDQLPFAHRVAVTDRPEDNLLIVHANPKDVNEIIFPSEAEQVQRYGRIRQPDADLDSLLDGVNAATLVFGHLHIPNRRVWRNIDLINISSVSMPGDGDVRAKYGLFTWDGAHWQFERRFVAYDSALELEAYRQAQPPGWESIVQTMEAEGSFPQKV